MRMTRLWRYSSRDLQSINQTKQGQRMRRVSSMTMNWVFGDLRQRCDKTPIFSSTPVRHLVRYLAQFMNSSNLPISALLNCDGSARPYANSSKDRKLQTNLPFHVQSIALLRFCFRAFVLRFTVVHFAGNSSGNSFADVFLS